MDALEEAQVRRVHTFGEVTRLIVTVYCAALYRFIQLGVAALSYHLGKKVIACLVSSTMDSNTQRIDFLNQHCHGQTTMKVQFFCVVKLVILNDIKSHHCIAILQFPVSQQLSHAESLPLQILQTSQLIQLNPISTMPKQGPGTKLVLKGLAKAFPEIAEQRAREEQEERDQLQFSQRRQKSRHDGGEDRRGPSTHSRNGVQDMAVQDMRSQDQGRSRHQSLIHPYAAEDYEPAEDFERAQNYRPESVRRGPSMHPNSRDPGNYSQPRGQSRVESVGRELSAYRTSQNPGGQVQPRGHSRAESIREAYSNHSNGSLALSTRRSTMDRGRNLSTVQDIQIRRG